MATKTETKSYEDTRAEIEETMGEVPGYFDALNETDLMNEWPTFRYHAFGETEIPPKYKELIGLAIAANLKCPYCQLFHREAAKMHGATEEELAEVSFLAGWTPRYSSMIHAQNYDLDQFAEEFERMADHIKAQMADD